MLSKALKSTLIHYQVTNCCVDCVAPLCGVCSYTSLVTPGRLAFGNLLVAKDRANSKAFPIDLKSGDGFGQIELIDSIFRS